MQDTLELGLGQEGRLVLTGSGGLLQSVVVTSGEGVGGSYFLLPTSYFLLPTSYYSSPRYQ